jgi:hypothetical protein
MRGPGKTKGEPKVASVKKDTLDFLWHLASSDDLPPVIRRKARKLVALWLASKKRGRAPKLDPWDGGEIVSFIDTQLRAKPKRLWKQAVADASKRFGVTERRIEQIYKELSERKI